MKHRFPVLLAALACLAAVPSLPAHSQDLVVGNVIVPDSSREKPGDAGKRMHTNFLLLKQSGQITPDAVPAGFGPADLKKIYTLPAAGGKNAIAIVNAYNYGSALNDFNTYAKQYGLPQETSTSATASTNTVFQVVYGNGTKPRGNAGWNQEEALDIEMAHAMAPGAKIYLVEATAATNTALYNSVLKAASLPNVKEVSMSFSGGEYSTQTSDDTTYFTTPGVVYFAATGDSGSGVGYPSTSPNVVACGGTSVTVNGSGNRLSETGWSGSGGGSSAYETIPSYQSSVAGVVGSMRGVPDISFDADRTRAWPSIPAPTPAGRSTAGRALPPRRWRASRISRATSTAARSASCTRCTPTRSARRTTSTTSRPAATAATTALSAGTS